MRLQAAAAADDVDALMAALDLDGSGGESGKAKKKKPLKEKRKAKAARRKANKAAMASKMSAERFSEKFKLLAEEWELKYDAAVKSMGNFAPCRSMRCRLY